MHFTLSINCPDDIKVNDFYTNWKELKNLKLDNKELSLYDVFDKIHNKLDSSNYYQIHVSEWDDNYICPSCEERETYIVFSGNYNECLEENEEYFEEWKNKEN